MEVRHDVTRSLSEFWIIQIFYLHCDQVNRYQHRESGRVTLVLCNVYDLLNSSLTTYNHCTKITAGITGMIGDCFAALTGKLVTYLFTTDILYLL